jgi:hypothetical protein
MKQARKYEHDVFLFRLGNVPFSIDCKAADKCLKKFCDALDEKIGRRGEMTGRHFQVRLEPWTVNEYRLLKDNF